MPKYITLYPSGSTIKARHIILDLNAFQEIASTFLGPVNRTPLSKKEPGHAEAGYRFLTYIAKRQDPQSKDYIPKFEVNPQIALQELIMSRTGVHNKDRATRWAQGFFCACQASASEIKRWQAGNQYPKDRWPSNDRENRLFNQATAQADRAVANAYRNYSLALEVVAPYYLLILKALLIDSKNVKSTAQSKYQE